MATLGIELCDAAFHAASCGQNDVHPLAVTDASGHNDWPGYASYDGANYLFGRSAEDQWFVHPRRVVHTLWARLAHEPSSIGPAGKPAAYSELAYHFFSDFVRHLPPASAAGKVVFAVPGAYLKDSVTEEEKIGLLLGMASDLKLPVVGIVDMACAALCDPRTHGFNPSLPVVFVDLHLEGADVTLLGTGEQLERKDFIHLPQSGYAQLLKHLTGTMGNRFLRHTAFDILEDGRIEQSFFRQTKSFLLGGAPEHRFQINTSTRTYEMLAKREQLATDAQTFVTTLVQGLQTFLQNSPHASEPCTIALADRAAGLPGIEARLRAAGFNRILRLPPGAAACGAARIGEAQMPSAMDLADVPVATAVPVALARRSAATWEARLQKLRRQGTPRPSPTHVVFDGIGHAIGPNPSLTIGVAGLGADIVLPDTFSAADDCLVSLDYENHRLWFLETSIPRGTNTGTTPPVSRTAVEAGDRLTLRCGAAVAEVPFVHCETAHRPRAQN